MQADSKRQDGSYTNRLSPAIILVCANGSTCPTVIGTAKNKDYVGGAEVVNTGDKRTVGVIGFLVTGMTDGGAGIGIVAFQLKAVLMDETVPPGFLHLCHIILFLFAGNSIPAEIGGRRDMTVKSGIGIAKNRNFLLSKHP